MRKCVNYFGEKQDFIKRRTTNFELSWANCFEIYRRTKNKKHRWREQQQHEITDWSEWKEKSESACFLFSFFNKSKKDAFCFIERGTPRGSERMYKILPIAIAFSFFLILVCIFSAFLLLQWHWLLFFFAIHHIVSAVVDLFADYFVQVVKTQNSK